jgi:NADH-quinone oxidoreductase subunit C
MGMSAPDMVAAVRQAFGDSIRDSHEHCGDATVVVQREDALEILRELRDRSEFALNLLIDVTAVDYLGRTPRFEVVYHLFSVPKSHRLRVKIGVSEDDPWVYSLVPLWKAANWLEREAWDMFGIRFVGHPDLRRILLYEQFVGHPLRKDYPVTKRQPIIEERDAVENDWKFYGKA